MLTVRGEVRPPPVRVTVVTAFCETSSSCGSASVVIQVSRVPLRAQEALNGPGLRCRLTPIGRRPPLSAASCAPVSVVGRSMAGRSTAIDEWAASNPPCTRWRSIPDSGTSATRRERMSSISDGWPSSAVHTVAEPTSPPWSSTRGAAPSLARAGSWTVTAKVTAATPRTAATPYRMRCAVRSLGRCLAGQNRTSSIGTTYASQASTSMSRGSAGMPSTPVSREPCTEPGDASQDRSAVRCWPASSQPASCAERKVVTTRPPATITRNTEVILKKRARLIRRLPRYMPQPRPTEVRMPSTAPIAAVTVLLAAWKVASRNTEVSMPSLRTARNAMIARACALPSPSACAALASRSRFMPRECLAIHSTMVVTKTTATAPMIASMPSCAAWGRLASTSARVTPMPTDRATAAATPVHIDTNDRPLRRRNAATMLTISAASRPSRRPMTNVASTATPGFVAAGRHVEGSPVHCAHRSSPYLVRAGATPWRRLVRLPLCPR